MYISAALVAIKCPPKSLPWAFHRQTCPQQSSKLGGPPFLFHMVFQDLVTWIRLIPGKPPLCPQETTVLVFTAYLKGKAAWSRVFDPSSGRAQDQAVLPSRYAVMVWWLDCHWKKSLTDHSILEKQGNLVLGLRFYMGQEVLCCEEDHIALGRLNKYPQGLLKPYVDNVFDSIIDRDTPDGVVSDLCQYTMLHIAAHKLMYDTIKKLNELGAKWLYVRNWLNQVVLLFRYAVVVHRLCKCPWMALDLTGNSTLSRRVLGSNVDLNSHYTDGTPKDDAYMEYDLGYAAGAGLPNCFGLLPNPEQDDWTNIWEDCPPFIPDFDSRTNQWGNQTKANPFPPANLVIGYFLVDGLETLGKLSLDHEIDKPFLESLARMEDMHSILSECPEGLTILLTGEAVSGKTSMKVDYSNFYKAIVPYADKNPVAESMKACLYATRVDELGNDKQQVEVTLYQALDLSIR
ncbi:hypothetical protein FAUST_8282 [Fusarium austroamericanum]|uniref:Uncharacterized protein n=1 Tax=Fusarium austroamericanum TaxID=282268 RepID=A0AAN6BY15_FUSAU|nr:hypothetical protein FAUST_8282 [Fusarium austroamericanum]